MMNGVDFIMKIIYGSSNKGKLQEVKELFKNNKIDVEVLSLKDINFDEDIEENGETFEENSLIKATAIKDFCTRNDINEIIITDDAGLCVDSLAGRPGVYSARYAGDHAPQDITLNKLLEEMKDVEMENRNAEFVCVLTASLPNGEYIVSRGETKGKVATELGTLRGLTYEPAFIPEGFNKPMSEMSIEEFAQVKNHRDTAMIKLFTKLQELGY